MDHSGWYWFTVVDSPQPADKGICCDFLVIGSNLKGKFPKRKGQREKNGYTNLRTVKRQIVRNHRENIYVHYICILYSFDS